MSDTDKQSDNQAITKYLLGALPEAEAERFDELSLSDDEMAETLRAAEKDLVDAFVHGELSGSELERFESYYLASPLRREKVQLALAFQALGEASPFLLTREVPEKKQNDSVVKEERWNWLSAFGFSGLRIRSLRFVGSVAALIVMILGGSLLFENLRLRRELSQTQSQRDVSEERAKLERELLQVREERESLEQELKQRETQTEAVAETSEFSREQPVAPSRGVSIASFVLKPQMRSIGQITPVSVPPNTTRIAFRLELEPNDYPTYRADLINNDQTLWQSGTLKASASDSTRFLSVSFGTHLLKEGIYILRVNGISSKAPEILSDYPFRVVK